MVEVFSDEVLALLRVAGPTALEVGAALVVVGAAEVVVGVWRGDT
jgi:hypothetical protein